MENLEIQKILEQGFEADKVIVEGDGYHYQVTIVSDTFEGLSRVKRQQKVYQLLQTHIESGALHALTLNTLTEKEWEEKHG